MPILTPNSDIPTIQVLEGQRIKSSCQGALALMVANFKSIFNIVWHNTKLTPQQVFDGLGTDASQFLSMAADLKALILKYAPSTSLPEPLKQLTVNQDGTVTVAA